MRMGLDELCGIPASGGAGAENRHEMGGARQMSAVCSGAIDEHDCCAADEASAGHATVALHGAAWRMPTPLVRAIQSPASWPLAYFMRVPARGTHGYEPSTQAGIPLLTSGL